MKDLYYNTKTKFINVFFPLALILGLVSLGILAKGDLGGLARSVGYAKSEETNLTEKPGNCSYYKSRVKEIKAAFMKDLGIPQGKLAEFLKELKNNPDKRNNFRENKQNASYNIETLLNGEVNNGIAYPSDLARYEQAIKKSCDPKSESISEIKTNIAIIKILAEGLKSHPTPEDAINSIWPEDYLNNQQ